MGKKSKARWAKKAARNAERKAALKKEAEEKEGVRVCAALCGEREGKGVHRAMDPVRGKGRCLVLPASAEGCKEVGEG